MNTNEQQKQNDLLVDMILQENIHLTSYLLNDLIQAQIVQSQSIFTSQTVPSISIQAYLRRIHRYTKYSPECLIIAIIYLDRYNIAVPEFNLSWKNIHRIFLSCLLLAVKFNDDIYFDNYAFQKGGGINSSQLAKFQLEIFEKLQFNAFVNSEEYESLRDKLQGVYGDA